MVTIPHAGDPESFASVVAAGLAKAGITVSAPGLIRSTGPFCAVRTAGRTAVDRGLRRRCIVWACGLDIHQATWPDAGLDKLLGDALAAIDGAGHLITGTDHVPAYDPTSGGGGKRRFPAVAIEVEEVD